MGKYYFQVKGAGIPAPFSYSSKLFLYFSNKEKTLN
nr:MAG TPA: hypothetical protein [Caudoviricetes sp.]